MIKLALCSSITLIPGRGDKAGRRRPESVPGEGYDLE